ncbi:transcription factor HES-2-like [Clytia hemisphaerica]|uniref:BHLH domain-containing protein n=1 Tax=Clytia hemisphaerica TaxID=252671 RepID=A0A7M5X8D4_9CNID
MTAMMHPLKEKRRANKPLLERKRRARINDSLTDLKHIVLSSLNKDVSKYTKMEKVDILDMTVRFLKGRHHLDHRQDSTTAYRTGYQESTKNVYQSIMTMEGIDHNIKCRILSNLANSQRQDIKHSPPPSPTISEGSIPPSPPLTLYNPPSSHHYSTPSPPMNTRLIHPSMAPTLPPLIRKLAQQPTMQELPPSTQNVEKTAVWRPW